MILFDVVVVVLNCRHTLTLSSSHTDQHTLTQHIGSRCSLVRLSIRFVQSVTYYMIYGMQCMCIYNNITHAWNRALYKWECFVDWLNRCGCLSLSRYFWVFVFLAKSVRHYSGQLRMGARTLTGYLLWQLSDRITNQMIHRMNKKKINTNADYLISQSSSTFLHCVRNQIHYRKSCTITVYCYVLATQMHAIEMHKNLRCKWSVPQTQWNQIKKYKSKANSFVLVQKHQRWLILREWKKKRSFTQTCTIACATCCIDCFWFEMHSKKKKKKINNNRCNSH